MATPIDDMLMIEGNDRYVEEPADEVTERIEVGNDRVRTEVARIDEPGFHIASNRVRRGVSEARERARAFDRAAAIREAEAVDGDRRVAMRLQNAGGAARRGDAHGVPLGGELLGERPRTHGVAESFARDAVENLHRRRA